MRPMPGRGATLRLLAMGAVVVLAMFAAYQLGLAGGQLLMLGVPLALAVFLVAALVVIPASPGGDASDDAHGWRRFELELERARRHERPMALLRIGDVAADSLRGALRLLDGVWVDGGHAYVVMPETDRVALARAIARITAELPYIGLDAMRGAVFPSDGLTAGALVARLDDPDSTPRRSDIVQLASPAPDVHAHHRTG